jgi:serine/threonine-protein phosphatase 6 regulatory ankyrin repeat subunit B
MGLTMLAEYKEAEEFGSLLHEAAFEGDVKSIEKALKYNHAINLQDPSGNTPLHLAVLQRRHEAIAVLLDKGANQSIKNLLGNMPIHLAAAQGDCKPIELLLSQDKTVIDAQDNRGYTPMHLAALYKQEDAFNLLVNNNANLSIPDKNECPVLYTLISAYKDEPNSEIIGQLVKAKPELLAYKTPEEATLLHLSAKLGHIQVGNILLKLHRDLQNAIDKDGKTFLDYAVYYNQKAFIESFIHKEGLSLEEPDLLNEDGLNKLHIAAFAGNVEMIHFLVKQGIDIAQKDKQLKTVLHHACQSGELEAVKAVIKYLQNYHLSSLVNEQDSLGNTGLHVSCEKGDYGIVKYLLEQDAKVNIPNLFERTPLHMAAIVGSKDMVDILLRYNARTQLKDQYKHTALYYALKNDNADVTGLLQRKGAYLSDDEDEANQDDEKAGYLIQPKKDYKRFYEDIMLELHRVHSTYPDGSVSKDHQIGGLIEAMKAGQINLAELLIRRGAGVNAKDKDGKTPLHWALENNSINLAELLIQGGAEVNAQDKDGWTPLHWAAEKNHAAVVELLIKSGAEVNAKDKNGKTPLHKATSRNSAAVVELLIKSGAEVNAKDKYGKTPLHSAALKNSSAVAELLIESGAEVNAKNKDGKTPLHFTGKNSAVAAVLIKSGAEVNAKDKDGQTLLQWAALFNNAAVAEVLKNTKEEHKS